MTGRKFFKIFTTMKITFESAWLLEFISTRSLDTQSWFRRFFRFTPQLLENIRNGPYSEDRRCSLFSLAVSWFRFGLIFKLTCRGRTKLADGEILRLASERHHPALLEVGASDGSGSSVLFERKQVFSRICLTDRYNVFFRQKKNFWATYCDADKIKMYLKIGPLSFDLRLLNEPAEETLERIETLNPLLEKFSGLRQIDRFDIFHDVSEEPYDLIKCANILNTSYFNDSQILTAIRNLSRSLTDGGYLILSQNHEKYSEGEAFLLLHRVGKRLVPSTERNTHDVLRLFQKNEPFTI